MENNDIKLFYDKVAERIANEWYSNDILLPSIKEFVELLPKGAKVLDLGCGPGHESFRLHKEGVEVVGVDISTESIMIAKERCKECSFLVLDFFNLDSRLGSFDGVFACASLIHVPSEKIDDIFHRINMILYENGYLLCIVQDGHGLNESWSYINVDGKQYRRPVYCYSKEDLVYAAEKHGFTLFKDGCLSKDLAELNWRSYIFKKGCKTVNASSDT